MEVGVNHLSGLHSRTRHRRVPSYTFPSGFQPFRSGGSQSGAAQCRRRAILLRDNPVPRLSVSSRRGRKPRRPSRSSAPEGLCFQPTRSRWFEDLFGRAVREKVSPRTLRPVGPQSCGTRDPARSKGARWSSKRLVRSAGATSGASSAGSTRPAARLRSMPCPLQQRSATGRGDWNESGAATDALWGPEAAPSNEPLRSPNMPARNKTVSCRTHVAVTNSRG